MDRVVLLLAREGSVVVPVTLAVLVKLYAALGAESWIRAHAIVPVLSVPKLQLTVVVPLHVP